MDKIFISTADFEVEGGNNREGDEQVNDLE